MQHRAKLQHARRFAKPASVLFVLLLMGVVLPEGAALTEEYRGRYTASATPFVSQLGCLTVADRATACAVAGGIVCTQGVILSTNVGGGCTPVVATPGERFLATAQDAQAQRLSWAVCVDGDGNGICRPESPLDVIEIRTCSQSQGSIGVQNRNVSGYIYFFIMLESVADAGCVPTSGELTLSPVLPNVPECSDGIDNDGDGVFDYPLDDDCDSLTDRSERPPPPPVVAH